MVPPNEEAQRQSLSSGRGTVAQKRAGDATPCGPGGLSTQNTPILMVGGGAALAARITCTLLCSRESGLSCLKIFKWMTRCSYKHSLRLSPGLTNVNCSVISFYLLSSRISVRFLCFLAFRGPLTNLKTVGTVLWSGENCDSTFYSDSVYRGKG